jgi:hypothetical protein
MDLVGQNGVIAIKHVKMLANLFVTKPQGFMIENLKNIINSSSFYKMIGADRMNWNPQFYWQIREFPELFTSINDHEVLAIAKDTQFCVVISLSYDHGSLFYQKYKNDENKVDMPTIFGGLMYAYVQRQSVDPYTYGDEDDEIAAEDVAMVGRTTTGSVFILIKNDAVVPEIYTLRNYCKKIFIENKFYDKDFNEQTVSVTCAHSESDEDFVFKDIQSEEFYCNDMNDVDPDLLEFIPGHGKFTDDHFELKTAALKEFLDLCRSVRDMDQEILGPISCKAHDALIACIVQSIICNF